MSQNVEHLLLKGRDIVLHRKMKDPDVFKREAFPDTLEEGRGNWSVTMSLPASVASYHVYSTRSGRQLTPGNTAPSKSHSPLMGGQEALSQVTRRIDPRQHQMLTVDRQIGR